MNRLPGEQDGRQANGWGTKCFINTILVTLIILTVSLLFLNFYPYLFPTFCLKGTLKPVLVI